MIKIEIPDKEERKKDFLARLKPLIKKRAKLMILSLKHLDGGVIDVNEVELNQYRYLTWKIVNKLTIGNFVEKEEFKKTQYKNTIANCLTNRKKGSELQKVNFNDFFQFLTDLLDPNKKLLDRILVCEASQLNNTNEYILNRYNFFGNSNRYIIKLIFDYENEIIGNCIKDFFRTNEFVNYCPYCNITEVIFTETPKGTRVGTFHQLDHFFDKGKHPLLACSFFNLIPSDSTCNGSVNKGKILFTDEFHLNPYIRGFNKDLVFQPIIIGNNVSEIKVKINSPKGSTIRKQMLGSSEELNEDNLGNNVHKEGNVNVFTLSTKYRNRTKKAQTILDIIKAKDNGMNGIKKMLIRMKGLDKKIVYVNWYQGKMQTSFIAKKFNDTAFSKFNRDIHDYYYENDKKKRNKFIRDFIN